MTILPNHELYHEIFGSILDQSEMTPFLLQHASDYSTALRQAMRMMANRGFDTLGREDLRDGERKRAEQYIQRAYDYFFKILFPFITRQLEGLILQHSANETLYRSSLTAITDIAASLNDITFKNLVDEDPRHLLLLASSRKYPFVFSGYQGTPLQVPASWQQAACSVLKMVHLIKSVEEDSQDINDYVQLGFFFEAQGVNLNDLYKIDWEPPRYIPDAEPARRAFVKVSSFFLRLQESLSLAPDKNGLIFNSGDGVEVEVEAVKARFKSPASMITKMGKNIEGEAYDIRDNLAITFILKDMNDTLKLFHALQKRGVILQENTVSHSITQTLYQTPESMHEAVRRLMSSLAKGRGRNDQPDEKSVESSSGVFYTALSRNAEQNLHSSQGHRKFQCKISFSVPIHRVLDTNEILIPGTAAYANRDKVSKKTEQHTLGVELRISDVESWRTSEQTGESHHDAYKFRQLLSVMNRVFKNTFFFPPDRFGQLRKDQDTLFHGG